MRRYEKRTVVERLVDFITGHSHLTGTTFFRKLLIMTEHYKIKEWTYVLLSLLIFLGMYYLFFSLTIGARFPISMFP